MNVIRELSGCRIIRTRWFAAYVRSRHESRVAEHLAAREISFFLPNYKEKRIWSDRVVEVTLPLFPGYLFVQLSTLNDVKTGRIVPDPCDRGRVLEAPGVLHLVGASGRPEALEDTEIEQLKMAMDEQHARVLKPRPHSLIKAGERVMITRGPLEGSEGILVREKNRNRVVLKLDLIQKAMSVEVDADAITALPGGEVRNEHAQYLDSIAGTRGDV